MTTTTTTTIHTEQPPEADPPPSPAAAACDDVVITLQDEVVKGKKEGEESVEERVCRICHLSPDRGVDFDLNLKEVGSDLNSDSDLIGIGCGCKNELGTAHRHCAETWFRLKGNRCCEICGKTAKNITGDEDGSFMEEWHDNRMRNTGGNRNLSERATGCWRGQPLCNFLMACLVIAFILPWFFRVNMF